jgi:aspartate racemase
MEQTKVIGVVGGVGPYAGIDLVKKIFDQTLATKDQDHLPVILFSLSADIEDRTAFLLGQSDRNPAFSIIEVLKKLSAAGASVAGIPCNTAHAPRIFDRVQEYARQHLPALKLLHMIEETAASITDRDPRWKRLGLLATTGTVRSGVYQQVLSRNGYDVVSPDEETQHEKVHASIYDSTYGIKAIANPVTERARAQLHEAARSLIRQGAEAIILGCTEIPLALPDRSIDGVPLIDPTLILARALIRETFPHKLKPLPDE